jgi:1-acyl-sn-glycerol-3-phosphate acyltransferase
MGSPPDEIVLVEPGTVPKTSSGKIRRAAAKQHYLIHQLNLPKRALRWQILRFWLSGVSGQLPRSARYVREHFYAALWWSVLIIAVAIGTIGVMLLPRLTWRWAAVRRLALISLLLMGIPVSVRNIRTLPKERVMAVFNHSSYADAIVLAAILPGEPVYLVKKELATQFLAGTLLRRLGVLFIDRYDLAAGMADSAAATALLAQGRLIVIFPEGTFTRQPGLLEFFTGAFKIASEAHMPVYPGVLRGTRSILRSDQWFPRKGHVDVQILDPVMPEGTDFEFILRLRDTVRRAILSRCGEPDLRELVKPSTIKR